MKSINRFFYCLILLCLSFTVSAQDKGIKWTTNLSWQELSKKARDQNKYIFVDCYATWCGPCKMMDNQVFGNDSVGYHFNNNFISVKVQMDRTDSDKEEIRNWYNDAESLRRYYLINSYPTFLFFFPNGELAQTALGFKTPNELISLAKSALKPGQNYIDPNKEYRRLLSAFNSGILELEKLPFLIKLGVKLQDQENLSLLLKHLSKEMVKLNKSKRYTKERMYVWKDLLINSSTKIFQWFRKDGRLIDRITGEKGYSARIVDKTIKAEILIPFLKAQNKDSSISMSGMYLGGAAVSRLKADTSEADWDALSNLLNEKFDMKTSRRNLLLAKIEWYKRHKNQEKVIRYAVELRKWNLPDLFINSYCWNAFLNSTDRNILSRYSDWMKKVVKRNLNKSSYLDTYANLLYKLGNVKQSIHWQQMAIKLAPKDKRLTTTLDHMLEGKPTNLNQGAIW